MSKLDALAAAQQHDGVIANDIPATHGQDPKLGLVARTTQALTTRHSPTGLRPPVLDRTRQELRRSRRCIALVPMMNLHDLGVVVGQRATGFLHQP